MTKPKTPAHTTVEAKVEVAKYAREVLDQADGDGMTVVETRLEEKFTGGLSGIGIATHLRIERPDGTGTLICYERITGALDGRDGSFLLEASGFTDTHHYVHGRWEIIAGSATLRACAATPPSPRCRTRHRRPAGRPPPPSPTGSTRDHRTG